MHQGCVTMIDWHGAVLNYCIKAYGKKRGEIIKDKLWYLENRAFFAMRGFTTLGWFKENFPKTTMSEETKNHTLHEMRDGVKALDEIISTAEYLKAELEKEMAKL